MNRSSTTVHGSPSRIILIGVAAVAVFAVTGCGGPSKASPVTGMHKQILDMQAQVVQLQQRIANQQETIETQRKQISALQQMGSGRPARLAPLAGIRFASLSGGYDQTGSGSDQGVVLYVQPYDADGDTLKVDGELTVQLFDLSNPEGPREIYQHTWKGDALRKAWNGRFGTSHFTARCPWPANTSPPRQVTVQARFLDYLTGRTFTCQAVFPIKRTEPGR
jgi:hypothetical protein